MFFLVTFWRSHEQFTCEELADRKGRTSHLEDKSHRLSDSAETQGHGEGV